MVSEDICNQNPHVRRQIVKNFMCKSTVNRCEDQLSIDVQTETFKQRLVSCQVPSITIWGNIHHSDYVTKLGTLRRVRDSRSSSNTNTAKWLEEIGTEDTDLFPFPETFTNK